MSMRSAYIGIGHVDTMDNPNLSDYCIYTFVVISLTLTLLLSSFTCISSFSMYKKLGHLILERIDT